MTGTAVAAGATGRRIAALSARPDALDPMTPTTPPTDFPRAYRVTDPNDPFETGAGPFWSLAGADDPSVVVLLEERHCNSSGGAHGGLLVTMADLAICAEACRGMPNERAVTVSLDASFVDGARTGEFLVARAELVRRTRSLCFVQCRVTCGDRTVLTAHGVTKRARRDPNGPPLQRGSEA